MFILFEFDKCDAVDKQINASAPPSRQMKPRNLRACRFHVKSQPAYITVNRGGISLVNDHHADRKHQYSDALDVGRWLSLRTPRVWSCES